MARSRIAPKKVQTAVPAPQVQEVPAPRVEEDDVKEIRARAYELFEQRGGEPGHHVEDWLQAEAELLAQKAPAQQNDKAA